MIIKVISHKSLVSEWRVKLCLLIILCFLFTSFLQAQTFKASIDREKILLGEQVTLQLAADSINLSDGYISNWPAFADTFNHIEIVKRSPIDTISVDGYVSYRQNFIVTSFDSGTWLIPIPGITFQNKINNKPVVINVVPPQLQVLTVDVSALQEYHPIKDVIDVDVPFNWKNALVILLIFLCALAVGIYLTKRKKRKPVVVKTGLKNNCITMETAIEQLQQLHISAASGNENRKQFHTDMDAICRSYFEEVLNIPALRATDSELENRLAVYVQNQERKQLLKDILDANKAVKFARFIPSTYTSNEVRKDAIQLIREFDDIIRQTKRYAGPVV